ncbi:heme exporter protein CcmB [Marinigracilibium pacificum]|uniref:ABC transporter permease n=1 Tax=Marinigracilibium pacificum TaxID=2729599 RepID=A0A848IX20_9BACT|nr:ABC transporter permease [Marinigracilibium pacificum]
MFKKLITKEIVIEWRQKYAINGILLYLATTIFITYLSLGVRRGLIHPLTWNSIFWIIFSFIAINAIAKSFAGDEKRQQLYLYSLVNPQVLFAAKSAYNILLLTVFGVLSFVFYSFVMGNPVANTGLFLLNLVLTSVGFAAILTMVSGIASNAENSATLMAVLSLPIMVPLLLLSIKISKSAIDNFEIMLVWKPLLSIFALDLIIVVVGLVLFPYLWRS